MLYLQPFFQSDLIPASVWEQIPFVIIIGGVFLYLARLYFLDQEKQRQARIDERKEEREAHEKALLDQREAQSNLLKTMLDANRETFELMTKIQAESLEDSMDKIAAQYYQIQKVLDSND